MREKSAAAMPVRLWAALTVKPFAIELLDDFGGQDGLEPRGIRILVPEVPEHVPSPAHQVRLPFCHVRAARNSMSPSLTRVSG